MAKRLIKVRLKGNASKARQAFAYDDRSPKKFAKAKSIPVVDPNRIPEDASDPDVPGSKLQALIEASRSFPVRASTPQSRVVNRTMKRAKTAGRAPQMPPMRQKRITSRVALLPFKGMLSKADGTKIDQEIDGLWACNTVEEVERLWSSWAGKFKSKCLADSNLRGLDDATRLCLEGLFDGTTTPATSITNVPMMDEAWHLLHRELVRLAADDPDLEVALVTFISGDGATSHVQPTIELHRSQAKVQATLRAMSPHFFGITELSLFNSTSHPDGGQLLQVHEHALVFGSNVHAKAREIGAKHMHRYAPNATDAPQIDVRRVDTDPVNLARISAYLFKQPHRCMTWCPPREGRKGHMHHSEKGDRFLRYLRMAMIRAMLTFEDVTFGGGDGRRIRSQLIKLVRARCEASAPPSRRLLHPDAIGAFCMKLAAALARPLWLLPVIARQR